MPVTGVRQQRSGDERSQCRRQARALEDDLDDDHGQQRKGRHGFGDAGLGNQVKDPAQHIAASQDDRAQGAQRLQRAFPGHGCLIGSAYRQQSDKSDHRDGGNVLEQQDRKAKPAMAVFEFALFLQHLQHHGR